MQCGVPHIWRLTTKEMNIDTGKQHEQEVVLHVQGVIDSHNLPPILRTNERGCVIIANTDDTLAKQSKQTKQNTDTPIKSEHSTDWHAEADVRDNYKEHSRNRSQIRAKLHRLATLDAKIDEERQHWHRTVEPPSDADEGCLSGRVPANTRQH